MNPFLRGFSDELVKLSADESDYKDALREARRDLKQRDGDSALSALRGRGAPVSRDYLASMLIGAGAAPLLTIAGKLISRKMANRDAVRALKGVVDPKKRKAIMGEIHRGPIVGRSMPGVAMNKRPLVTHGEMASDAAKGVLGGTVIQMIRDHFAGSSNKASKN